MTETVTTGGQATADSTGTTAQAPAQATQVTGGQAQTTANGSAATADESFFDPRSIADKPELQAAYKQMQGEFTRRMQSIRGDRQKIDAYNSFLQNPIATIQQLAPQYGLKILQGGQEQQPQDFNPQSWDDVKKYFFEEFKKEALNPLTNEVRNLRKQNIEQSLDAKHPDWRTYEDSMMDLLKSHPTLVNDPDTLYRMAVPSSVIESRATAAALAKIKGGTEAAQVSGGQTTKQTTDDPTGKPMTFAQAAARAQALVRKTQGNGASR